MENIKFQNLDLKEGDIFTEFLSYWVSIVKIDNGRVISISVLKPQNSIQLEVFDTIKDFFLKYKYSHNSQIFIKYVENNKTKTDLVLEEYKKQSTISSKREVRINELLYNI